MKKVLILVISALITTSLVSCGGSTTDENSSTISVSSDSSDSEGTDTTTDAVTDSESNTAIITSSYDSTVLLDNDSIKITYTEISSDEDTSSDYDSNTTKINLTIENKFNETIRVSSCNFSINGSMASDDLSATIESGKTSSVSLEFNNAYADSLENVEGNIIITSESTLTELSNYFLQLFTTDSYLEDQEKSTTVLVNTDSITINSLGKLDEDAIDNTSSKGLRIQLINKSNETLSISLPSVSIDGESFGTYYTIDIPANSTVYDVVRFNNFATGEKLSKLKNIEGAFDIKNSTSEIEERFTLE